MIASGDPYSVSKAVSSRNYRVTVRKSRNNARRQWLIDAKNHPCADCGIQYPYYVMDLDHVRGEKLDHPNRVAKHYTKAIFLEEVTKCDVVCANCHRERTQSRLNAC